MEETKICCWCKVEKPFSEFYKNAGKKYGLATACKICQCNRHKTPDGRVEMLKSYAKRKEYYLWKHAEKRAKDKGLEFTITKEDIVIPEVCPVLGIPIYRDCDNDSRDNSPSVDRIDSSKGYTKDNICVISMRANQIKNSGGLREHQLIVDYIKENTQVISCDYSI